MWAEKGFEVAWDEFELPSLKAVRIITPAPPLSFSDDGRNISVSSRGFIYVFSKASGMIESLKISGDEMIKSAPSLNLWRAPLANETDEWGYGWSGVSHQSPGFGNFAATEWYSTGLDRLKTIPTGLTVEKAGKDSVVINSGNVVVPAFGWGGFINRYRYVINGDGEIRIEHSIVPDGITPSWLPRIGLQWILDSGLDRVTWYGRGPQENYPDRKSGYRTDIYSTTVGEMYEPYLIPQDYGLRTDNRWVRFINSKGTGLEFHGSGLFNFNAYPYETDNLTRALYTYQLHKSGNITFNLDYATSGVGCTALSVFPRYRVLPVVTFFATTIKPVFK